MKRTGKIPGASNFTYEEFLRSDTADAQGIDNVPDSEAVYDAIKYLATTVLQPLRDHFGKPIFITSGYRSAALNKAVNGASTSHHLSGAAADIRFNRSETELLDSDIFDWIYNNVGFTELIAEGIPSGWVHVASVKGRQNEKAVKYMLDSEGLVHRSDYASIMDLYKKYGS